MGLTETAGLPKCHHTFGPRLFCVRTRKTAGNNHKEDLQPNEDCKGERFSTETAVTTDVYKTNKTTEERPYVF